MKKHFFVMSLFIIAMFGAKVQADIMEFNTSFIPKAVITHLNDTPYLSSSESVDNLNAALRVKWSAYKMEVANGEFTNATFLGSVESDNALNQAIDGLEKGIYKIILTVTNVDGISSTTEDFIVVGSYGQKRSSNEISSYTLSEIIHSFRNGIALAYIRAFVSNLGLDPLFGENAINVYIIPKLEQIGVYGGPYKETIRMIIIDGLTQTGHLNVGHVEMMSRDLVDVLEILYMQ